MYIVITEFLDETFSDENVLFCADKTEMETDIHSTWT